MEVGEANSGVPFHFQNFAICNQLAIDKDVYVFTGRFWKLHNRISFQFQNLPDLHVATAELGSHLHADIKKMLQIIKNPLTSGSILGPGVFGHKATFLRSIDISVP